ncbi:hypothetical protein Trydic_g19230 [Trypoxylus dichotomus]
MSKCPLQIYLNDKFSESCPSERVSHDILKRCPKQEQIKQQESSDKAETTLENDKRNTINNSKEQCKENCSHSFLDEYLQQHSNSIEAYHTLQKQQEEVLQLCKIKLAKRYPSLVVTDEDIIKALKIAEDSDHGLHNKSSTEISHVVLSIIISDWSQKPNARNSDGSNDNNKKNTEHRRKRSNRCHPDISISEYFNTKGRKILNKFVSFFTKSHAHKPYLTSSDNYFNNCDCKLKNNFTTYPTIAEDVNYLSGDDKVAEHKQPVHKSGDTSNTSASTNPNAKRLSKKRTDLVAYYCTYQKDVDFLKSEIRRQKYEIRSIQKNLTQCLSILKTFDDKQQMKDKNLDFLNNDQQTLHVFTPNEFKGYDNPAEPYSRFYQQFKAETGHCTASCSSETKDTTSNTSSSDNKSRRKCCSCSKKPSQKRRKKKMRKKSRSRSRSRARNKRKCKKIHSGHRICMCPSSHLEIRLSPRSLFAPPPPPQTPTLPSTPALPPTPSPPLHLSEAVTSPPPPTTPLPGWIAPPDCICEKIRQQAILDRANFPEELPAEPRVIIESESTQTSASNECPPKKKKIRRKVKKRKAKKRCKEQKEESESNEEQPEPRKPCWRLVKLLRIICCSSGCF